MTRTPPTTTIVTGAAGGWYAGRRRNASRRNTYKPALTRRATPASTARTKRIADTCVP